MKRSIIALTFLLAAFPFATAGEVDVAIRFYDKRVYYAGKDGGPVRVQVTVANKGAGTYRFKLADERSFSVDFEVRTLANVPLAQTEFLSRKRAQDQPVFFREVSVEPGESFSFVEDLRDYAVLDASGAFVVQARLHPELLRPDASSSRLAPSAPLPSNRLALDLRPPRPEDGSGAPLPLDVETGAVLVRRDLPPDQVVSYFLTARQKGQWEKFFLYLDVDALLARDGARRRAWLAETEEGRRRMADRYRADLMAAVADGDIAMVPIEFKVERTSYGDEEGTVVASEKFRFGTYVERKRYTYYLRRRDDAWTIYDYAVVNLGAE